MLKEKNEKGKNAIKGALARIAAASKCSWDNWKNGWHDNNTDDGWENSGIWANTP